MKPHFWKFLFDLKPVISPEKVSALTSLGGAFRDKEAQSVEQNGLRRVCILSFHSHWRFIRVFHKLYKVGRNGGSTGGKFFLLLLNPLNTKLPFLPILYKL